MKNIISTVPLTADLQSRIRAEHHYSELDLSQINLADAAEKLAVAHGLLVSPLGFEGEIFDYTPALEVVSTVSVGYNHLPVDLLKARGIMATHTPTVLDDTVADTVMALMLATSRRVCELDAYVKAGKWHKTIGAEHFGRDVHHKTLGIIGLGRIGQTIAKRATLGFDMDVCYYDVNCNSEVEALLGIRYSALDELLANADFVVLMIPYNAHTANFMNLAKFKQMKQTAIFVNAARGQVVDESALLYAIENKLIFGAGLDVFVDEPLPVDHPFLAHSNIVTTPHIGSAVAATRQAMAESAVNSLLTTLRSERPTALLPEMR